MKELVLLRHAKSAWDDPSGEDFARPLSRRGRGAATAIGAWLARNGWRPELVLCSAAARTRETWALLAPALGGAPAVRFSRRLYLAEPDALARRLARVDDAVGRAMLVGHNPGIAALALGLVPPGAVARRMRAKFPTGAAAWFALEGETWREALRGQARLLAYVTPADLDDG